MGNFSWPSSIRPLTSRNYSFSRGSNVVATKVGGGLPRQGLDSSLESPIFNLTFSLTALQHQVINVFYDGKINHGANSFKMTLDSGNGLEEHQCLIVPNTWKISAPHHGRWYLSVQMQAEVTSSQLSTNTNLYDLYELYGDTLGDVLAGLKPVIDNMPDA